MNGVDITSNAVKFKRARGNLLAVVAFTLINVLLAYFESDLYFLFSAAVPLYVFYLFQGMALVGGNIFATIGLLIAILGVSAYFFCWLLSKRVRVFILVALILFAIDSLIYLLIVAGVLLLGVFDFMMVVEIAFRVWVFYYLIIGTIAWAKLRGVSAKQVDEVIGEVNVAASAKEESAALEELSLADRDKKNKDKDEDEYDDRHYKRDDD